MSTNQPSQPRHGITVPFDAPLHQHKRWYELLVDLGYTDIWSSEVDGGDGFTPLALAAAWTPTLNLGIAIAPAFTRGPALIAQTAAAMADAAPGRFALGLGSSSEVIVERWNGVDFVEPYKKVRDVLRFVKAALTGERVDQEFSTFESRGFRLGRVPDPVPPVYLAALRPGMLSLAGREADGAILNWLSADDVKQSVAEIGGEGHKEVVARIFVVACDDQKIARGIGRRMITAYLNVEAYAEFQRWLGRGPALQAMWDKWAAGDRKGALEAIPDEVVDDLIVHGSLDECREKVARYVDNGVTVAAPMIIPVGIGLEDAVRGLAPVT
ncbi:MAG: LLM class F420-dependent oxidoreductase [Acidimicrobiales bacterium]